MKTIIRISLLITFCVFIAACTDKRPPVIVYDKLDFVSAAKTPPPPRPVHIVPIPKPVPLPGQLKALEDGEPAASRATKPWKRIEGANRAARMEPDSERFFNAIQVYPFTEGALYRLYAAPEKISDITLQAGEALVSVSAGDTVRWIIGDTISGSGAEQRVHILVKPMRPGLSTNLVIVTDRRSYHLELRAFRETYMAAVSWHYPEDALTALMAQNEMAEKADARSIDTGLDLQQIRFRYSITGDDPPWRPLRAFDDGRKVYIEFPTGLSQGEAPPLFTVGAKGDAELVNYRVKGRYYIVDQLFAAAELRHGEEPQAVVRISRTDGRSQARLDKGGDSNPGHRR